MKKTTRTTLKETTELTSEEVEAIIKKHLGLDELDTVDFDVSSGGLFRGCTTTRVIESVKSN